VPALLDRRPQRVALHADGDEEDDEGHPHALELVRLTDLLDPLEQGEQPAEGEQDEGHHERPEVPLPAVAEGVLGRGRLAGPGPAEEQEPLVPGVGEGVDGLGQHRRRPGDDEAHQLGERDRQVGHERGDDCLLAALLHGGRC
jgi:hypothetical protein